MGRGQRLDLLRPPDPADRDELEAREDRRRRRRWRRLPGADEVRRWHDEERPRVVAANRALQGVDPGALDDGVGEHFRAASTTSSGGHRCTSSTPASTSPPGCSSGRPPIGVSRPAASRSCWPAPRRRVPRSTSTSGPSPRRWTGPARPAPMTPAGATGRRRRSGGWRSTPTSTTTAGASAPATTCSNPPWASGPSSSWPPPTRSGAAARRASAQRGGRLDGEFPGPTANVSKRCSPTPSTALRDDDVGVCWNWPLGLVRRAGLEIGRRLADRHRWPTPTTCSRRTPTKRWRCSAVRRRADHAVELARRWDARAERRAPTPLHLEAAVDPRSPLRSQRRSPGCRRSATRCGRRRPAGSMPRSTASASGRGRPSAPPGRPPPDELDHLVEGDVLVAVATTTAFNAVFPLCRPW